MNWEKASEGYTRHTQGIIHITVNNGVATAELSGSGKGTKTNTCVPSIPWTDNTEYEIKASGTVDPKTGAVALTGTLNGSIVSDQRSCNCETQSCEPGGETWPFSGPVALDGVIDPNNHTGKGQVKMANCTIELCAGDWSAGE